MSRLEIIQKVTTEKAVIVARINDSQKLIKVAEALLEGGLTILEVSMTTPNALKVFEKVIRTFINEMTLGVGTIMDAATARLAINSGAQYIVCPIYKPEIIHTSHRYNVAVMLGCFTPTKILNAHEQGADFIKVFPADVLGMEYFRAIKAPMPHLKLIPFVGVSLTNAGEWLKAGACAVGISTPLLDEQAIAECNWNKIKGNAKVLRSCLDRVK
jgi:2-dehydro-3-deoxyphosphogluconate aldolase/(4S)-4-hydroxy-2-oxoglutarate aldolase